jgi:glycosyltransferase involved in cell wall biosynthesis
VVRPESPDSISVVIVAWNSMFFLPTTLAAVRRFSPADTEVIVVDNHSEDGTVEFLRSQPDVRYLRLPTNIGHGAALDIGALCARGAIVVALDVDAFPIDPDWLERLTAPLERGAHVSGVRVHRHYAHPCTLAIRRDRFVERRHTFSRKRYVEAPGKPYEDAGERVSLEEAPFVHLFERDRSYGPGWLGTVWAGLTYHNFYSVRHQYHFGDDAGATLDGITQAQAQAAWQRACREFLGTTVGDEAPT